MMYFHASRVHIPSRQDVDYGEGWIQFEWKDDVLGWECLTIQLDGFCERRMPLNSGHGIQDIELERNRIRLRFWPTLAANLKLEREVEIEFDIGETEFGDLNYAVDCVGVDDRDVTDNEIRDQLEEELNRRIAETEEGIGEEISGDEMRRIARESLER